MIKVTGSSGVGGARPMRGAATSKPAAGVFKLGESSSSESTTAAGGTSASVGDAAPASALGALIALQSEGRGSAKNRAMAERLLMLLDRLRDGLLSGRIAVSDLVAIANAADAKLADPDAEIAALYEEIALRARVELAKLGRF